MTRKNKIGLIITIVFLMLLSTLILTSSIGGITYLRDLKYLIDNGREVDGNIVELEKGGGYGSHSSYYYYSFTLIYKYEENGTVWKTHDYWSIREDRTDELNEMRDWCENQVGKTVKLTIDDKGHCEPTANLPSKYKGQYDFVWIRGGILIGIETVLLIILLVIIFKVKVKNILAHGVNFNTT